MLRILCFLSVLTSSLCECLADQPILLVTPQGVWQADVTNGVPGPFKEANFAVVIQGFDVGGGGGNSPIPKPPTPTDPLVVQVSKVSISLANKEEATAAAALVNSLSKAGLKDKELIEAMLLTSGIVDTQLKSGTRIRSWCESVSKITKDPKVLIEGLVLAWGVDINVLNAIESSRQDIPPTPEEQEALAAFDIAAILAIIKMVISLLQQLGII